MLRIALRPKWIAALVFALALAAGFALLGQWQLSRSFEEASVSEVDTETVVPLSAVAEPNGPLRVDAIGQFVEFDAEFVAGDSVILVDRLTGDGRLAGEGRGAWVVAHAIADSGPSIPVALGWAVDEDAAAAAIERFESSDSPSTVVGRLVPSESPEQSDYQAGKRTALAVAELINLWADAPDGVYGGYVVVSEPLAGLNAIDAPPPIREVSLNLLNVFYAVEWVIFAGFAVYLWWRLVRDEWEKERKATTGERE